VTTIIYIQNKQNIN